jgi:hypothetical protein
VNDLAKSLSGSVATWIGDCTGQSFPRHYLSKRRGFHSAAREGSWTIVQQVIRSKYDQRQADWFNFAELSSKYICDDGFAQLRSLDEANAQNHTLLHEIALHGPPHVNDNRWEAWQYIIETMGKCQVWCMSHSALQILCV